MNITIIYVSSFLYSVKIMFLYAALNWAMLVHLLCSSFSLFHRVTPLIETQKLFVVVFLLSVLKLKWLAKLVDLLLITTAWWHKVDIVFVFENVHISMYFFLKPSLCVDSRDVHCEILRWGGLWLCREAQHKKAEKKDQELQVQ